jgi:hypothetical protein
MSNEDLIEAVQLKINNKETFADPQLRAVRNILEKSKIRSENFQSFGRALDDTLPELENKSIEMFQKKFLQTALEKSKDPATGRIDLRKFGQFINRTKARPKVSTATEEGKAGAGFIDPSFENKSIFQMIFPEGQGDDLIETISQLSRNIADDKIDDITIDLDEIIARKTTPNTGSKDVKDIITKLKEAKTATDELLPPEIKNISNIIETQSGAQALRAFKNFNAGKKVSYFNSTDNYINRLKQTGANKETIKQAEDFRQKLSDFTLADILEKAGGHGS